MGRGFLAGVTVRGRALAEREGEVVWMYGVNPGGLAENGPNADAAHEAFRRAFTLVLFDLAEEAATFSDFRDAVRGFVYQTNEPALVDWRTAVAAVRGGKIKVEGIPFEDADSPLDVAVVELQIEALTPKANEPAALEPAVAA